MAYLSSLRHGAAAVRSAAAIDHPAASLEKALAQRAPEVPSPKDTQRLLLGCSCCTLRRQRHALLLRLNRHAAQAVRHGISLTQTLKISPVSRTVLRQSQTVPMCRGRGSSFQGEVDKPTWTLCLPNCSLDFAGLSQFLYWPISPPTAVLLG